MFKTKASKLSMVHPKTWASVYISSKFHKNPDWLTKKELSWYENRNTAGYNRQERHASDGVKNGNSSDKDDDNTKTKYEKPVDNIPASGNVGEKRHSGEKLDAYKEREAAMENAYFYKQRAKQLKDLRKKLKKEKGEDE